jgi:hypothetical protein
MRRWERDATGASLTALNNDTVAFCPQRALLREHQEHKHQSVHI